MLAPFHLLRDWRRQQLHSKVQSDTFRTSFPYLVSHHCWDLHLPSQVLPCVSSFSWILRDRRQCFPHSLATHDYTTTAAWRERQGNGGGPWFCLLSWSTPAKLFWYLFLNPYSQLPFCETVTVRLSLRLLKLFADLWKMKRSTWYLVYLVCLYFHICVSWNAGELWTISR